MTATLYGNARIFTPHDGGKPLAGTAQGELSHYPKGALLVVDGVIRAVGDEDVVRASLRECVEQPVEINEVDCGGRCMVPGFVDPHTHICFASTREEEFSLRLAGTPYLEILAKGGGILSSVRAIAAMDEDELFTRTLARVQLALSFGTTSMEIKSGYGLDLDNELKMLRVIGRVGESAVQDVVATFLGAHAVPECYRAAEYGDEGPDRFIDEMIATMLPAVVAQGIAQSCDIFCEKGVFTIEQGRRLLSAAAAAGLRVKIHADEVHDLGGAGLAAELKAQSADHLLAAGDAGLQAMADASVIATLLPATAYSLRKPYARARDMIKIGLPVALATDCNPGSSFTESMPFAIGLAIMAMGMTPEEALTAATLNSAYALSLNERVGSLDVCKQADFLLLVGESPAILAYHAGVSSVEKVYKKGALVWSA